MCQHTDKFLRPSIRSSCSGPIHLPGKLHLPDPPLQLEPILHSIFHQHQPELPELKQHGATCCVKISKNTCSNPVQCLLCKKKIQHVRIHRHCSTYIISMNRHSKHE